MRYITGFSDIAYILFSYIGTWVFDDYLFYIVLLPLTNNLNPL